MTPPSNPELHSLRAMRDEIRLKLHLAAADAKVEWKKLEPQLEYVLATTASVALETIADLETRAHELSTRLKA